MANHPRIDEFLAQRCIAVAGVSRNPETEAGNTIYRKLRDSGYRVFPINPHAETVEGDRCYADLKSVPEKVEAVVIATQPAVADDIVRQCAETGVKRVWLHRSFGQGSVSQSAVELCRQHQIEVIAGGCPMMFCKPVDFGHKCMRWLLGVMGKLPD